jgi:hypothetical protein
MAENKKFEIRQLLLLLRIIAVVTVSPAAIRLTIYYYHRWFLDYPIDLSVATPSTIFFIVGMSVWTIASCLDRLERRLRRLENTKSDSPG